MQLTLVTPATAEPLTLEAAKLHLRVTGGGDDELITRIISAARQLAESYTGLSLAPQGWRLETEATDTTIHLPRPPLTEITTVTADGVTIEAEAAGDMLVLPFAPCALVVDYTSGYTECPAALLQALLQVTAYLYEHRGDDGGDALAASGAAALLQPFRRMRIA